MIASFFLFDDNFSGSAFDFAEEVGSFAIFTQVGHNRAGKTWPNDQHVTDAHIENTEHFLVVNRAYLFQVVEYWWNIPLFINHNIALITDNTWNIANKTSAGNMANLEELKSRYGKDLVFCGAVDTQHILPQGTPEEVRQEMKRVINILGRDGGYMVASVHTIMHEVPPENILAMVDAVEEFGYYPLNG